MSTLNQIPKGEREFTTTHWSVVLAAGDSSALGAPAALEALCRAYWHPLYAYARGQGHSPEDAQDLTQAFFARLLEKKFISRADPQFGRFRSFLVTSFKRFLTDEWRKATRQKRGGSHEVWAWDFQDAEQQYLAAAADWLSPDKAYEKRWAAIIIERVLGLLAEENAVAGKGLLFAQLKDSLWGEGAPYAQIASCLGLTEGAVKASAHRLRQRCRELLRAEIAQTVAQPEDINEELRHLVAVFSA